MNDTAHEFYSVLIQTSGVIVAIVGGFLASAWINLSSKKIEFLERIAQLRSDIELDQQDIEDAYLAAKRTREAPRYMTRGNPETNQEWANRKAGDIGQDRITREESVKRAWAKVDLYQTQLADVSTPEYSGIAMSSLIILSVTGILLPLFFMTTRFDDGCRLFPQLVLGLFVAGLVGVAISGWWQMRRRRGHAPLSARTRNHDSPTGTE